MKSLVTTIVILVFLISCNNIAVNKKAETDNSMSLPQKEKKKLPELEEFSLNAKIQKL